MDEATEVFINHSRGVSHNNGKLILSSIFDWYGGDFYGSDFDKTLEERLTWLSDYAEEDASDILLAYKGGVITRRSGS